MSNTLKKAREWHLELRQTLVVEDIDKETKDTVRNYAEILDSLIKQAEQAQELEKEKRFNKYLFENPIQENKRLRETSMELKDSVDDELAHLIHPIARRTIKSRINRALELK